MALYHFHVDRISRSEGQTAVSAAAYRSGEKLHDYYYGEEPDYTRKGGVLLTEIILPEHVPEEYRDREKLWNAVEAAEKNPKAQLAYSFDFALQNELDFEENVRIAREFIRENFTSRGMICDVAYTEKDIEKRIAGEEIEDVSGDLCKVVSGKATKEKTEQKLDVVLDIQSIIAKNKGPGYEQWAKRHNIKAISKTLIFLSERGLESYKKLSVVAEEASERFDTITSRQKEIEKRMSEIKELRQHIFNYAKSKKVYAEYKAKKYDEKFFEEHREPLTLYKAAKEAFKKYDGPIPTIRELDAEFQKLLQEKRQLYSEYKIARTEMQELLTAKQNVEQFLGKQNLQKQDIQKKKDEASL